MTDHPSAYQPPIQPPEPDPRHDRPRRAFGLTATQWLATVIFLLILGAFLNAVVLVGERL